MIWFLVLFKIGSNVQPPYYPIVKRNLTLLYECSGHLEDANAERFHEMKSLSKDWL